MSPRRKKSASSRRRELKADRMKGSSSIVDGNITSVLRTASQLVDIGDFDGAVDAYKHASSLAPRSIEILDSLAEVLMEAGKPDEAQAALQESIKLAPSAGFEKYMYLSQLLGNTREAVAVSQRGIEVLRREKSLATTYSERMSELTDFEVSALCSVAEILLAVIEESSDQAVGNELDGQCERSVGEALAVCREGSVGEIEATLALGNLRLSQGRREEARVAMTRVARFMRPGLEILECEDPDDEDIVKAMGMLPALPMRCGVGKQLIEVSLWREAMGVLSSTLFECDFNVEVLYLLALSALNCEDYEVSQSFIDRCRSALVCPEGYAGFLPEGALEGLARSVSLKEKMDFNGEADDGGSQDTRLESDSDVGKSSRKGDGANAKMSD